MSSWLTIFLGILLIAYSCAPVPPHELAEVMDSCGCEQVGEEALKSGNFLEEEAPPEVWWKKIQDPLLIQLIERALVLSPTLQRAEASLKAAEHVAKQKQAVLFPELWFDAEDDWQHLSKSGFFRAYAPTIPPVVNDITVGLSFSYEFDFWGKNRDIFEASLGQAAALAAERIQAELILTTSIAYTYTELQLLLLSKEILERRKSNELAIQDFRLKRQQNALDTAITQLGSQANTLEVQTTLTELDLDIENQIHKLKALIGVGQDAQLVIKPKFITPLQVSLPKNLSLDLISRRPDLIAQKARIESASKEIGAAKKDFYPNIDLMSFIGLESVKVSKLFQGSSFSGSITPAIHLPIFTAGRLRAHLKEKVANFNEAVYAYNQLILQTAQEVADRLTDLFFLEKEIENAKALLQIARKQADLTQRRRENALDNLMDVKLAENVVLKQEIELVAFEYGKQLEAILLIRALGGGYYD